MIQKADIEKHKSPPSVQCPTHLFFFLGLASLETSQDLQFIETKFIDTSGQRGYMNKSVGGFVRKECLLEGSKMIKRD